MPLPVYQSLADQYTQKTNALKARSNTVSLLRLLLFCGFIFLGYKSIQTGSPVYILSTIAALIVFLLLIRFYDSVQNELAFNKALVKLNTDEFTFLSGQASVYSAGKEYTDPHHAYSYDLDIFGDGGLFPYLNRTSSSFGKQALAQSLLHPDTANIQKRQQAIRELAGKLEFRQHLQASGMLHETKESDLQQLKTWLQKPAAFKNKSIYYLLMIFPLASLSCLFYYFFTENEEALNFFYRLFVVNLLVAFSFTRSITAHLNVSTSVTKILQQFAQQFRQIEKQSFQSSLLVTLQGRLKSDEITASNSIARLATLFNYLETVINLVVSVLLNGLFLFHIHVLFALEKWKKQHAPRVMPWLEILGEAEALNSFANACYNNDDFCTPQVSTAETLVATNMGHPLIQRTRRVNNSVSFAEQPFVILTGSNMSGKSTFLRTLGINLVLARAGCNVCAASFVFYPYPVHVSMRITDSLQDSESFFYAELKRLQGIIHELEAGQKTFVILDEILRGTNSNDKHNGTVGLIKKLMAARACGIIATHDLTVADLTLQNPGYLSNKCFESEIINNELVFDYKLKDGVCTRLSASFLMKKMEIIN